MLPDATQQKAFDSLPAASILKKLDAHTPGLGLRTLQHAESLQNKIHAMERDAGKIPEKTWGQRIKDAFRAAMRDGSESMLIYGGTTCLDRRVRALDAARIFNIHDEMKYRDSARVGDFIRAAVREQMAVTAISAQDIGLTDTEIDDLNHCAASCRGVAGAKPGCRPD